MYLKRITLDRKRVKSKSDYPFCIPVIQNLEQLEIESNVTFFVGENGSGKSTLLEAIADKCGFHTAGGGRNNSYEAEATQSDLGDYVKLSWMPKVTNGFFLRAETFHQFASYVDSLEGDFSKYDPYGGDSLHHQSHGESFLSLFQHRFHQQAIYLLDEPEAALSPQRQLAFLRIMHDLASSGQCQFIIATHSPILLGYPDAKIWSFDRDRIAEVAYEDTDHYQITRYFLDNRERMLMELFKDEE
ncbi:AAA family ATPase [Gracilibacillus caseinilyticus]|uniref:AAA family ATPase n=1 Tax=Gracilibacillus caseinilyticus TaxID=2932256 RepID=A0ABY4EXI5_9BACI|nr:AAA family ATPase [Gracilibacillus caseinilyticus]UOQ48558.1 AAA family ATPase [Gracilibacillus caseinilyticus]